MLYCKLGNSEMCYRLRICIFSINLYVFSTFPTCFTFDAHVAGRVGSGSFLVYGQGEYESYMYDSSLILFHCSLYESSLKSKFIHAFCVNLSSLILCISQFKNIYDSNLIFCNILNVVFPYHKCFAN